MALMKRNYKKKAYVKRRPIYKRRAIRRASKKYNAPKYFTERVQLNDLQIPNGVGTEGGTIQYSFTDSPNSTSIAQLFDLYNVVSIKYEIVPINSYIFGTSPVPAPNFTFALEDNPDNWGAPTSKSELMQTNRSRTRTMDAQKTSVIMITQKLPPCSAQGLQNVGATTTHVSTQDTYRRRFKWYSIPDLERIGSPVGFGALNWWAELPTGVVPGANPLNIAEVYLTVKYAVKSQV